MTDIYNLTATIANGASLSDALTLDGRTAVGIIMPAAWTAAGLTFQASFDGTTYVNAYQDDGTEYSLTVGVSQYVILVPADYIRAAYIKVRSGTAGAPVNQLAERSIGVVVTEV